MSNTYCTFKSPLSGERCEYLHPQAQEIMNEMTDWCKGLNIPFVITETVTTAEEDKRLSRVSSTHREGRAFDVSTRGWKKAEIDEFMAHFDQKFLHVAAIGAKSGKAELIVHHDSGHGEHFHVQIGKVFAIRDPLGQHLV